MKRTSSQSGFVILYAVLLTTVVLGIGIILLAIITKQIQLATLEKSSQAAYFAADSGRQCALYWDHNSKNAFGYFAEGIDVGPQFFGPNPDTTVSCYGGSFVSESTESSPLCVDGDNKCSSFHINNLNSGTIKTCASVTVRKVIEDGKGITQITSNGYNQPNCGLNDFLGVNPRRVQRTIVITKG